MNLLKNKLMDKQSKTKTDPEDLEPISALQVGQCWGGLWLHLPHHPQV